MRWMGPGFRIPELSRARHAEQQLLFAGTDLGRGLADLLRQFAVTVHHAFLVGSQRQR